MKYLLTEEELKEEQAKGQKRGYNDATRLLDEILKGARDLRIGTPNGHESLHEPIHKDNPWRKLVELLDKKDDK